LLAGTPLPFLPAQILWLNLVTNGIQDKGLAFESGERDVMSQAPRPPRERIFNRQMIQQTLVASSAMAVTAFGLWYYLLNYEHYNEVEARNTVLLLMVLLQNFHVFNTRSEKHSAFRTPLFSNWWLIGGIALAQLVHIVAMQVPVMQNLLQVQPISYANWTKLLLTAAIIVVVLETFKAVKKRAIK
jgi:magnesium-transporting ATPase (P-type)